MNDNDSQISPGADSADLLKTAAQNSGATANATAPPGGERVETQSEASESASTAEVQSGVSAAPGKKPATGIFGKVAQLLGGDKNTDCNCGRSGSGRQGRHAKTCPVSKNSGGATPKHFGDVILPQSNAPAAGNAPVVSQIPTVPPDYSLWGRLSETALSLVDRACQKYAYSRCAPIIGKSDAHAVASDLGIDKKDIEGFSASAVRCAEHYKKNPTHAPIVDLGLHAGNIAVHLWAGFDRMNTRLAEISAKLEKNQEQKTEEGAR